MNSQLVINSVLLLCVASLLLTEALAAAAKSRNIKDVLFEKGYMQVLNSKHLSGILIFITACCYYPGLPPNHQELFEPCWNNQWSWICIMLTIAAFIVGYKAAPMKKATNDLRSSSMTAYFVFRIIFLLLYECFCRGILLYTFIEYSGVGVAIPVNIGIYAALHAYSDRKEIIGAVPFGLLLCIVTILHHSVWPAILIHVALAMGHEMRLAFTKHPPIKSWKL